MDMTEAQRLSAAQYSDAYGLGLLAARRGASSAHRAVMATDQGKAGYAAGYRWGLAHMTPAVTILDAVTS
jgi:hypothetical protein